MTEKIEIPVSINSYYSRKEYDKLCESDKIVNPWGYESIKQGQERIKIKKIKNLWLEILLVLIKTCFIVGCIFVGLWFMSAKANNIQIIGCINQQSLETRKPNKNGNCLYGSGWQNIILPTKEELKVFGEIFKTKSAVINRLPIVNFESGFNENASNKFAKGYVQTLRVYKIPGDIKSQLQWMKNRQDSQKKGNCSHRNYSEDAMIRCLYNRHYGMMTHNNWYSNKLMVTRQYYKNYLLINK